MTADGDGGRGPRWASRAYGAVLRLYPRAFRLRYGDEALGTFELLHAERRARRGRPAAVRYALRCLGSAARGAVSERLAARREVRAPVPAVGGADHPNPSGASMSHDIRYAFRSLWRQPAFALTVTLLIAAGIGAATTVFSVVDGVLLRRLPYPEPDRLVYLSNGSHPPVEFREWEREITTVGDWGGIWTEAADLTGDGPPQRLSVGQVTPGLFRVLGARVALGRTFAPDDHVVGTELAVLSHAFWRTRFGGDPGLVGRDLRVGDRTLRVIGVLEPGFTPPGLMVRGDPQVWTPLDLDDPETQDRGLHVLEVVGRLAEGAELEQARTEMAAYDRRLAREYPEWYVDSDGNVEETPLLPLKEAVVGDVGGTLLVLLGAVGLLLLLACANVANLLLARGADRARELAVRGALGATRRNLVSQLTVESLVLAIGGGIVGTGLGFGGVLAFTLLEPGILPRSAAVALDGRVLLFALVISLLTGLLFGVLPALQSTRVDPNEALKEGTGRATPGGGRARFQGALVVAEVALSLVLLVGAGLLFHSFLRLTGVETGFRAERMVTVDLQLRSGYEDAERARFVDQLLPRLRAIPGTEAAVAAVTLPFQYASGGSCCWRTGVSRPGAEAAADGVPTAMNPVTAGYFAALGMRLVAGRDLAEGDGALDPLPVVVNESFASLVFGGAADAVGEEVRFSDRGALIVGVSGDVRYIGFERGATPELYMPWEARGPEFPFLNLGIRTDREPGAVAPAIRAAIWDLDPDLPIPDIVTMEGRMSRSVADERFYSAILAGFALIALLLAAAGVYATLLYSVRQRVREMGIRLALGAKSGDVVRLVLRRGLALTAIGIALGLAGALAGARFLGSMVFGITPRDPATLAAVSGLLALVALGACLLPAIRAGRTNPLETLRAE